ncbi:MAG: hypothetical protein V3U76_10160 [Granulosicoccus sp.]
MENTLTIILKQVGQWFRCITAALLLSVVSACAATQAVGGDSQSIRIADNSSQVAVTKRHINWERADADRFHGKNTTVLPKPLGSASSMPSQDQGELGSALAVPLLLPSTTIQTNSPAAAELEFSEPVILLSANGYTAVLKNDSIDIVIDATDSMMVTADHREDDTPEDFDGEFQLIEGGGGGITIGRYGALYYIQLMCNHPSVETCVTETMVRDVIESLSIAELPADARQ